ncbi:MAG: hypothetical protein GY906_07295 [bacterium]|nr:hypothetical protein [bacterium]
MRTSVIIPDDIIAEVRRLGGDVSISRFIRESVQHRLEELKRQALLAEMEVGYRAELDSASLDPEWTDIEVEGL